MSAAVLWLKLFHIAALAVWSAGLFLLPALLAAYPQTEHPVSMTHVRARTRFAFVAIISPAAVLAIISGALLVYFAQAYGGWLFLKLTAVAFMAGFHVLCGALVFWLHERPKMWSPRAHQSLVLAPSVLIPLVLWLVLSKPL